MKSSCSSRPDPLTAVPLSVLVLFLFGLGKCLSHLSPMVSTFDVVEECPIRTVISGVSEYLNQLALLGAEIPNSTTFHIMGSDTIARSLTLNPKSGVLTVSARIDREALCGGARLPGGTLAAGSSSSSSPRGTDFSFTTKSCIKPLNILIKSQISGVSGDTSGGTVRSDATTNRKQILLRILDTNDNAPRWPGYNKLIVNFVETFHSTEVDRLRGYKVDANDFVPSSDQFQLLERAVDLDAGLNGTVSYTLKGIRSESFRLEDVDLTLHGGSNRATAGDTGPVDFAVGTNYDNQMRGGYTTHQPLRIWPNILLDRETVAVYNLTLVAYDSGNPQLSSSIPLEIHITDVNDNAPIFHSPVYESNQRNPLEDKLRDRFSVRYTPPGGHLLETATVGSPVLQLNATDADTGVNAKVTYLIAPSDKSFAQQYFSLDQVTGLLKVKAPLDYDLGPRHFTFTVLALDGAPEPYRLTSTALVHIELADVNDEPPKIEILIAQNGQDLLFGDLRGLPSHISPMATSQPQELVAYIEETPSPDTVIAYVQVSDRDEDGEDVVRCFLGPRDNFTLQSEPLSQGQMEGRFKGSFDFGSVSGLRETGRKVTDYRILPKVPSGLQSSRAGADMQGFLDRETTPSQVITITCTDSAGNQADRKIRLHLLDINDNPPRFLNDGRFSFSVAENVQPIGGQPIWLGRVVAVDPDLGDNAKISYRLAVELSNEKHPQRSDAHSLFFIKEDTGDMYAQMSLDRENAPEDGIYTMTVLAVDHGRSTQLTGTAKVEVVVLDVNDWAPEFTRDIYTFTVPEDAPLREVIGVVEAIDRDATALSSSITYHMNAPKITRPYGSLEGNSQVSKRSLNASVPSSSTTSTVTHANSARRSESTRLAANETEDHEVLQRQPRQLGQGLSKREQQSRGGPSYAHQSGQPIFLPHLEPSKLTAQLPLSYFSVDSRTGEIRIIRKLDRETNAYFTFEVIATDSPPADSGTSNSASSSISSADLMTPPADSARQRSAFMIAAGAASSEIFTATATVAITITDANDNAPEFRHPNTSILLPMAPDETLGHKIITVQAVDRDEGENARISYSIRSEIPIPPDGPGTGCFAIDEASGLIFLTRPIRGPVNHRLVVEACDHGAIPRCTSSPSIRITASDDVKPGSPATRPRPHTRIPGQPEGLSEVDRFGYEGYYQSSPDTALSGQQNDGQVTHRIEVIAACLVVIFGVLLFAAVVFVCLLKRRPHGAPSQGQEPFSCNIWGHRWPLFRRKAEKATATGTPCNDQGVMGDTRLTDSQALRSPTAKGTTNTEPVTNTLDIHSDGEKKPLYYDGIDTLPDTLVTAGVQHIPRRTDNQNRLVMIPSQCMPLSRPMLRPVGNVPPGYAAGGTFVLSGGQQSIIFNGLSSGGGGQQVTASGGRIYGTLPVVSTILSGPGEMAACQMRPAFHPAVSHAVSKPTHALEMPNPPSPDYQSLDTLANDNERLRSQLSRNQFFPSTVKPLLESPIKADYTGTSQQTPTFAKQSASYGCLIDSVESPPNHRMPTYPLQNYYEITALNNNMDAHSRQFPVARSPYHSVVGGSRRYQRSATLGRLGTMTEALPSGRFADRGCVDLHHQTAGDLTFISPSRPYSRLQTTQPLGQEPAPPDDTIFEHDKPTKYTYQAIREASFV